MRLLPIVLGSLIATAAWAQSAAPILIIGGDEPVKSKAEQANERALSNFPEWAVTRAATTTGGYDQDIPPTPESPAAPTAPTDAQSQNPPAPATPASPPNPVSKLWPVDTVPIFMRTCVGVQPKLIVPCKCVIGRLITEMPHDEFLALTAKGTIESDPRLQNIRVQCADATVQQ